MVNQIITPDHKRWEEFINKLRVVVHDHYDFIGQGNCTGDLKHSERVLRMMGNVDVEGTLEFIRNNVAECDHKVLVIAS